ncbi:Helix-turn-helix domain-containing protein, partial [Trichococcus palustris]
MTQRFSLMQRMMASATPFSVFFEIVPPHSRDFSHELGGTVFFFTSSFANACSEVYNEAKEVSIMLKAYQFRLYPNREQKIYFANC